MKINLGMLRTALVASVAVALALLGSARGATLHTADCVVGQGTPAVCGFLPVFEDRKAGTGRTIDIHFVVLKATQPSGKAIFWNPGGPGASATAYAPFIGAIEPYLSRLRDRYDIVFVDNRGTGASHQLQCHLSNPSNPAPYFLQIWPDAALRSCRSTLEKNANLSDYTTDIAADDLDDVRAALGYSTIVLNGGSYGTEFFLDYARRHPQHVESILLQGVAPPHFLIIPLEDARGAQTAMTNIIQDCAAEPACSAHFPHLKEHFQSLLGRFDRGPLTIKIENAVTHKMQTVALSKEVFSDRLRQTLYANESAAYVPFILDRAYAGDYVPLGKMIEATTQGLGSLVAIGDNLSTTCAEDIPFISEADIVRTSLGTFEGDARVRAQQRACAIWNVRSASGDFQRAVRTSLPVFMIAGADDPATPPEFALEAVRFFSNGKVLVIKNESHEVEAPCTMTLSEQFIREASVKNLDTTSCAGAYHRPAFATSLAGFGED
jgi:pimeloyl-ACP methyl ester carboxylesterase